MTKLRSFFKPAFYGFMLFLFTNFFMPEIVLAQSTGADVGAFRAFLEKAARLFFQSRNALFVIAIFAFLVYAWEAILKGSISWEKIFYLIVGLTILGVAGFAVNYMAGGSFDVQNEYQELNNVEWQNK